MIQYQLTYYRVRQWRGWRTAPNRLTLLGWGRLREIYDQTKTRVGRLLYPGWTVARFFCKSSVLHVLLHVLCCLLHVDWDLPVLDTNDWTHLLSTSTYSLQNTINLTTLSFGELTKAYPWPNASMGMHSMTAVHVATRSQLCDAVFILKFLWSFYKPLPATTHACLIMCFILLLGKLLQTLHVLNFVIVHLLHA